MAWKVEVQTADSVEWIGNGVRLDSESEAQEYAKDLNIRWTSVGAARLVETKVPANYCWKDGKLEPLKPKYKPTATDKAWTKSLIGMMSNGGVWGWPDSGLIYTFDKKNCVLRLTFPKEEEMTAEQNDWHEVTRSVFETLDWKVEP